ncbi:MAG: tetratricopeptide repeat-containing sensor histidine kinase [Bacteroidetes bacterium]|nr:tetratricopeptide repeat-containing sensor histidine kinase [Bacteroidota bacterium]
MIEYVVISISLCCINFLGDSEFPNSSDSSSILHTPDHNNTKVYQHFDYHLEEKKTDSTLYYDALALNSAQKEGNKSLESEILFKLGQYFSKRGKITEALEKYKASLRVKVQLNDSLGIAAVHDAIGDVYRYLGNFNFALEAHLTALNIYEILKDSSGISNSFCYLGLIQRNVNDLPEALKYYKKAFDIRRMNNDQVGISEVLSFIGTVYWYLEDYEKALDYYQQSLEIRQRYSGGEDKISGILNNLGNTYRELGELEVAQEYYKHSIEISERIGDDKLKCVTLKNIGILFKEKKQFDKSIKIFNEANFIAQKIKYNRIISEVLKNEAEVYEAINKPSIALELYKQYSALNDSIFSAENSRKITEFKSQYDLASKERTINELEGEKEKNIRNFLLLVIGLMILLSVIIVHRFYLKVKMNRLLKEQQKTIIEKNIELENLNEDLVLEKEKAERSDRLKSEFLAQISHEIRSPINTIQNYTSLIEFDLGRHLDSSSKEYFHSIHSASSRLIRTIDLVLNMSELETGSYVPSYQEIDIIDLIVAPMILEFKNVAKSKGLFLDFVNDMGKAVKLYGDHYTLSQILSNLIDNAIKYTNDGSVIVSLCETENSVELAVSDTGIGIAPEYIPRLFDKFSQEEQGYTRRFEGSGLGLALVKNYCKLNNAAISVESEKDVGSTFRVTIKKKIS